MSSLARRAMATVTLAATVLLLPVVAPAAAPVDAAHQPLVVQATSLVQDGQQLVWSVRLTTPFSPSGMRTDGRTMCLVVRRANASVSGVLCVAPPRPRTKAPVLVYQPVTVQGRGPGRVITATVTRSANDQLTGRFLPGEIHVAYAPMRWQVLTTLVAANCQAGPMAHVAAGDCISYSPAKPPLLRLHVPVPVGCVPAGRSFISSGPTNRRVIALTFDDGPWYTTPQFLAVLERKHVPATFFQIGRQVAQYGPAVDRRMLADGDVIGDHTWDHANVAGGGSFAAREITSTAAAIRRLTGFQPCLFRAPGGGVSPALISDARSLGFMTVGWNIDPRDWSLPGTGAIVRNVLANARKGAIIIQHDGGGNRSETLAALPTEIDALRARGYTFVTIPQLLGLRLIYK